MGKKGAFSEAIWKHKSEMRDCEGSRRNEEEGVRFTGQEPEVVLERLARHTSLILFFGFSHAE